MTIDEAIDYIEDINSTVTWTKEQEIDRKFFENVAEWLEELKDYRLGFTDARQRDYETAYAKGQKDGYDKAIDDFVNWYFDTTHSYQINEVDNIIKRFKAEQLKEV